MDRGGGDWLTMAGRFGKAENMTDGRRSSTAMMTEEKERSRKERERGGLLVEMGCGWLFSEA